MASLIRKKVGNKFYYYIVESQRIRGRPRIVSQVYLGTVESILKKFRGSQIKTERRGVRVSKEERKSGSEEFGFDLGFGGIFKGIGNFIDLLSEMMEKGEKVVSRTGEIKGLGEKARGVYGFTVKMGLGGEPTVEQFGNIRQTEKGPVVEEVREPVVDIFNEKDKVLVIAELPGVEEKDVSTEVKGDILTIEASNKDRKYAKEVLLPQAVEADKMQSSYKNGVLEIVLPKSGN